MLTKSLKDRHEGSYLDSATKRLEFIGVLIDSLIPDSTVLEHRPTGSSRRFSFAGLWEMCVAENSVNQDMCKCFACLQLPARLIPTLASLARF